MFALLALVGSTGLISRLAMSSSSKQLPLTRSVFQAIGYLPIRNHYYEPLTFTAIGSKFRHRLALILFKNLKDFTFIRTIARPDEFKYEYLEGNIKKSGFRIDNGSFGPGDAESLYYFVRGLKPKKIIEIGAGNSSLIINSALKLNTTEGSNGEHIIIEPYENPWLEKLDALVIRLCVEEVDFSIFQNLSANDIVFIDSSHVVRAQNDCVFEYTELLPSLPSGVVVHIHDIFTPFDYPDEWLNKHFNLWTEQYMLEALLANSGNWEILAPLNWLSQESKQFKDICPFFEEGMQPGSMWIRRL